MAGGSNPAQRSSPAQPAMATPRRSSIRQRTIGVELPAIRKEEARTRATRSRVVRTTPGRLGRGRATPLDLGGEEAREHTGGYCLGGGDTKSSEAEQAEKEREREGGSCVPSSRQGHVPCGHGRRTPPCGHLTGGPMAVEKEEEPAALDGEEPRRPPSLSLRRRPPATTRSWWRTPRRRKRRE